MRKVRFISGLCILMVLLGVMLLPSSVQARIFQSNVDLVSQIGGIANALAVQGNYAYVGMSYWLVVFNIADRAHPIRVG